MAHIMTKMVALFIILTVFFGMTGCNKRTPADSSPMRVEQMEPAREAPMETSEGKIVRTEAEWKSLLTPEKYDVLRRKGTERPFTGKYNTYKEEGVYKCGACGAVLFSSDSKFDSHCGWPAFSAPVASGAVVEKPDTSHGIVRTEITCPKCGSHLGHVFDDGPGPTGLRYCINSAALDFEKKEE